MATTKAIGLDELRTSTTGTTIINAGVNPGKREIRGAVRYRPHDLLQPGHLALPLEREATVVVYDEGGPDEDLTLVAHRLADDGFRDVRILDASLDEWEEAGGPTQEPLEQAVPAD
jgi:3-mercaptopyruvate sulfurtransferase SseA